jgi:hypothetical protein
MYNIIHVIHTGGMFGRCVVEDLYHIKCNISTEAYVYTASYFGRIVCTVECTSFAWHDVMCCVALSLQAIKNTNNKYIVLCIIIGCFFIMINVALKYYYV